MAPLPQRAPLVLTGFSLTPLLGRSWHHHTRRLHYLVAAPGLTREVYTEVWMVTFTMCVCGHHSS